MNSKGGGATPVILASKVNLGEDSSQRGVRGGS